MLLPAAPPPRPPETDDERRARHLETLREMAELAMAVARDAAAKSIAPDPEPAPDPGPKPGRKPDPKVGFGLTFARATRAVRETIALEARIAAGELARPRARGARPYSELATRPDPRRLELRQRLHKAADTTEPDRTARAALRREIDACLEAELAADPEAKTLSADIMKSVCSRFGLPFDITKLPDHFISHEPIGRRYPPPWAAAEPLNQADPHPPWPDRLHPRE